jgi:phenylacetaldehyde dehydrogenase
LPGVTDALDCADVTLPRGGYKESGWGRELGAFGPDDFTELKTVIADIG